MHSTRPIKESSHTSPSQNRNTDVAAPKASSMLSAAETLLEIKNHAKAAVTTAAMLNSPLPLSSTSGADHNEFDSVQEEREINSNNSDDNNMNTNESPNASVSVNEEERYDGEEEDAASSVSRAQSGLDGGAVELVGPIVNSNTDEEYDADDNVLEQLRRSESGTNDSFGRNFSFFFFTF
jgi:hypothetical protein